jgi:SAM-dependent methyltransferase
VSENRSIEEILLESRSFTERMVSITLRELRKITQKDLLELKYWIRAELLPGESIETGSAHPDSKEAQKAMQERYLREFRIGSLPGYPAISVLEIGAGPYWGMLQHLYFADRRIAVDPLINAFEQLGLLEERGDIQFYSEPFEQWDPSEYAFDAILCANALDHGEMGFHLLPKISRLLKPGGSFYLYVHLRPKELLNLLHDHSLTLESLDKHLSYTPLIEVRREIRERDDIAGWDCPTLIGIWQKPL